MTRSTSTPFDYGLADDEFHGASLASAKIIASTNPLYPDDQLHIELKFSDKKPLLGDFISLKLGLTAATKEPSRLRQLLNALAEKERDAEVWFDKETLEWGYDLAADSPAYAVLLPGMAVEFRGAARPVNGVKRYKISGYRAARKAPK